MTSIILEFAGGSEVLFDGKRRLEVELSLEKEPITISYLLTWMLENLLKNNLRTEMLIVKGTVRPGILVLVNDTDWEILGGLDATIKRGDSVTFISTLHGG